MITPNYQRGLRGVSQGSGIHRNAGLLSQAIDHADSRRPQPRLDVALQGDAERSGNRQPALLPGGFRRLRQQIVSLRP
jgi:hypothetical protein